jgi:hypothetical protein
MRAESTIQESRNYSKHNGYLIITAPFCSLTHYAPYHFITGFNKYWFENHLKNNQFIITEITSNGNFFEYLAQEIYRVPLISTRYAQSKPRLLELLSMYIVQRMLLRFSKCDSNSAELLCFGYNVLARKR